MLCTNYFLKRIRKKLFIIYVDFNDHTSHTKKHPAKIPLQGACVPLFVPDKTKVKSNGSADDVYLALSS